MASDDPLPEFGTQRQPRRKLANTYGKKKVFQASSKRAHQAVFGQDESDLGDQLAKLDLNIDTNKNVKLPSSASPPSIQSAVGQEAPQQAQRYSAKPTPGSSSTTSNEHTSLAPLFALSSSTDIEQFTTFGSKLSKLFEIEKIGEGSFAEVFKITSHPGSSLSSLTPGSRSRKTNQALPKQANEVVARYTSIIKVIPLDYNVDDPETRERCSTVKSIAHEVNILKQLDPIHGFTRFRGLRLVSGPWPASFLSAFREFRKRHRKRAINAPPDQDFGPEQIYALVEMDDAGTEISLIKRPSVFQVWDIFWISTILLANAEEIIDFEHRDLHMSNICVKAASDLPDLSTLSIGKEDNEVENAAHPASSAKPSTTSTASAIIPDINQTLLESINAIPSDRIGMSTLRVTIIDYTVARARLPTYNTDHPPLKGPSKLDFTSSRTKSQQANIEVDHDKDIENEADHDTIIFDALNFTSDPLTSDPNDLESSLQNQTYKKTRAIALLNNNLNPLQDLLQQRSPSRPPRSPSPPSTSQTANHDENDKTQPDNKWRAFIPRTNVVWLGYLLRMLIHRSRSKAGKLNVLKGKTGKTGNNKFVKELQESMWDILIDVSKSLNGSDFREVEGLDGEHQSLKATTTKKNKTLRKKSEEKDEIEHDRSGEVDERMWEDPVWTDEELDSLPFSALEILEIAVGSGWLSLEEIQRFRVVLEEEDGS